MLAGWLGALLLLQACGRIGYSSPLTDGQRDAGRVAEGGLDAAVDLDAAMARDAEIIGDSEVPSDDASTGAAASDAGASDAGASDAGSVDAGSVEPITLTFCDRTPSCRTGTVADTYVSETSPVSTFGGLDFVSFERSPSRVGLVRFDISEIPTSAVVTGAELRLVSTDNSLGAGDVTLHVVLDAWSEAQATFEQRAASTPWTSRGVGVGSREAASVGTITPTSAWTEYVVVLPASVVQAWVDDPATNFGLALVGAPSSGTDSAHFASHEHAMVGARPLLRVTYRP